MSYRDGQKNNLVSVFMLPYHHLFRFLSSTISSTHHSYTSFLWLSASCFVSISHIKFRPVSNASLRSWLQTSSARVFDFNEALIDGANSNSHRLSFKDEFDIIAAVAECYECTH